MVLFSENRSYLLEFHGLSRVVEVLAGQAILGWPPPPGANIAFEDRTTMSQAPSLPPFNSASAWLLPSFLAFHTLISLHGQNFLRESFAHFLEMSFKTVRH